ncbi:MAG: hypothetical protein ACI97A_000345 [Planctomycetota bacterium]|jgi:hypothetical protein
MKSSWSTRQAPAHGRKSSEAGCMMRQLNLDLVEIAGDHHDPNLARHEPEGCLIAGNFLFEKENVAPHLHWKAHIPSEQSDFGVLGNLIENRIQEMPSVGMTEMNDRVKSFGFRRHLQDRTHCFIIDENLGCFLFEDGSDEEFVIDV